MGDPATTYSDLATWAASAFGLVSTPTKSAICKAIKRHTTKSERADSHARTQERQVSRPDVEQKVVAWVLRCEELGVCITGELIRKQAMAFSSESGVSTNLKFSKGWLHKLQRKHGFTSKVQHGEAGSTPQALVDTGRAQMLDITAGYSPVNVFNMDETSFFYCLSPHRSITRNRVPGTKKSKKRITLALTTNATGTDMIDPLFIGTAAKPRCFRGATGADLGFDYQSSKKAWMNRVIFNKYLTALDEKMVEQDRKVLLLVDNAPPHQLLDGTSLANINLHMLPPNTTAYLQPQDAGIIASFKAKVKQRQLQNALEQINSVMNGRQDRLYEVPLVEAMGWAKEAWRSVSSSTITNCWARTCILDDELAVFGHRLSGLEIGSPVDD
ncbi:hypothetical protein DYB25_013863 [Aphanomyces astaci]|uniref:HTH CENPB-type domain-containing protein n=1 Tax=Aphanomyces astaci TaxID=112090 RepID=A0A396ZQN4_APHAT|nr:hypothetical protein DYB25_013863 [Aphanomyces astaci]